MKRLITLVISLLTLLSLTGCAKNNQTIHEDVETYTMTNGLTPSDMQDRLMDAIRCIYAPYSQADIDKGLNIICSLSTERFAEEFSSYIGEYTDDSVGSVLNLEVTMTTQENTAMHTDKYVVTFDLEYNGKKQSMLLEFRCDTSGEIDGFGLYVTEIQ